MNNNRFQTIGTTHDRRKSANDWISLLCTRMTFHRSDRVKGRPTRVTTNSVLGNVMGSNIFNLLAVLAIPTVVGVFSQKPYFVDDDGFNQFAIPLMLFATLLLVLVSFFKVTPRSFGVLFLLLYIFFVVGSFLKINLFLFF